MRCYPDAVAHIKGGADAPRLLGEVRFYQQNGCVLVVADLSGLSPTNKSGFFALHIHEGASCEGTGFSQTGGHYAPQGTDHPHHAGDLPPLLDCHGSAYLAVRTDRFRVSDVMGRTVVIHSGADDF
ncbi:MAG: superoxide dismutase family protein, partial [Oscillospiraceae bacterium]|nr:superoxide dismutase family protein [Oscillospiraceae bacterium]